MRHPLCLRGMLFNGVTLKVGASHDRLISHTDLGGDVGELYPINVIQEGVLAFGLQACLK